VVLRRNGDSVREEEAHDPVALYSSIKAPAPCASIGYLTDVGWTEENIAKIKQFFPGLTLLCADCTFLGEDVAKARASYHLCTTDLSELASLLEPRFLLPMHLSKSYLRRTFDLYGELRPPLSTTILQLPKHIVPAPLMVRDVEQWLRAP
jgi:ribonuclease Z